MEEKISYKPSMNLQSKRAIDFKTLLQEEFLQRCRRNKAYSLRAYASSLNINHSSLSRILNGKRAISGDMMEKIGSRLGLSPLEIESYKNLEAQEIGLSRLEAIQISTDQFHFISEWYHLAFLELIKIEPAKPVKHYAKCLGISNTEMQAAIDSLERLDFLSKDPELGFIDTTKGKTDSCTYSFTSDAKKKYQKQVFQLALEAIEKVDIEKRSHSGMTMAINSQKLAEAKLKIARFREELCEFLQEGDLDQVYHIGVGLFPLTQNPILSHSNKEKKNEK